MPFLSLEDIEEKELLPGYKVHFVHSDNMTFAYWSIEAGSVLPKHSHHHEQVATIIEGEFELTIDDETKVLGPGEVAIIPSNKLHSGKAVTQCRLIDAFYPIREDYMET